MSSVERISTGSSRGSSGTDSVAAIVSSQNASKPSGLTTLLTKLSGPPVVKIGVPPLNDAPTID